MLVKLKNELLGGEFNILDFDNKMENLNFYSEYDAYTEELLESGAIIYLSKKIMKHTLELSSMLQ